ncbi:MAG: hypothetical protein KA473_04185 [Anaerolineales bacterium]|nr:hypothetical protein [Anaerolineales bacterium]MBP6208613.1 hypothetical protein [Anaerolineales bacterium]
MTIENYLQEASALATLAGILGGFAFSAVVQLLGLEKQSKVLTASIITFAFSSMLSFYAVIVFVFSLAAAAEANQVLDQLDVSGAGGLLSLLAGVYIFLVGVALAGWIRSKVTGIATTAFAVFTMCITGYTVLSIISSLPVVQ